MNKKGMLHKEKERKSESRGLVGLWGCFLSSWDIGSDDNELYISTECAGCFVAGGGAGSLFTTASYLEC